MMREAIWKTPIALPLKVMNQVHMVEGQIEKKASGLGKLFPDD
jgi:hypothetical protein